MKIKYILILILALISCDKEIEVINSFDFDISENHRATSTINLPSVTNFKIDPERVVTTNIYFLKYIVESGKGFYQNSEAEIVKENQWTELSSLDFDLFFIGELEGENTIKIFIKDNFERERSIDLSYTIEQNLFDFTINTVQTNVTIDEPTTFTVILLNNGNSDDVTFTGKAFFSQGTGVIETLNNEGNRTGEIEQTRSFDIIPGAYNYSVTLKEDGLNVLVFEIIDSNGQKVSKTIEFTVNVINFDFTAVPEKNTTNLGQDININFNIRETDGGNDTYTMNYVKLLGDAAQFSGPNQISAGTNTLVILGDFSWRFSPIQKGKVKIEYSVSNTSGVSKTSIIEIEVLDRDFSFTATRNKAEANLGEQFKISMVISEQGGATPDNYQLTYESSKNGQLFINGTAYNPGTIIVVPSLNFNINYQGDNPGEHEITLNLKALSNKNIKSQIVSLTYLPADFSFDVKSNTVLTVGNIIDVRFDINEISGNNTFDVSYTTTGLNPEIKTTAGTILVANKDYDVTNKLFSWKLKALKQGDATITYKVKNQFGLVKEKKIIYTFEPIQFDFSSSPIGTNFLTGEPIKINFDMNASNTLTYQLSFSSSGNGKVIYNGRTYNEDQNFTVTNNNFSLLYTTSTGGFNTITWKIKASNGVIKTNQNTIRVGQKPIPTQASTSTATTSCNDGNVSFRLKLVWTKDPNSRIVSARLRFLDNRNILDGEVNQVFNLSSTDQFANFNVCYVPRTLGPTKVEVVLTDSNGFKNNPTILTF